MAQASITHYFNKRKRTGDDFNNKTKVLRLDPEESFHVNERVQNDTIPVQNNREPVTLQESNALVRSSSEVRTQMVVQKSTVLTSPNLLKCSIFEKHYKNNGKNRKLPKHSGSRDIREILKPKGSGATAGDCMNSQVSEEHVKASSSTELNSTEMKSSIVFELKGCLSPAKKSKAVITTTEANEQTVNPTIEKENEVTNQEHPVENSCVNGEVESDREGFKTPKKVPRNELNLEELKKRLKTSRSAKLLEMRKRIERLNDSDEKLRKIEQKKKELEQPAIKQFQAIEIEVPSSPQKSIYNSPQKIGTSPQTTPTKSPAFKQYASLTVPTISLPLPFNYNHLTEVFRCVDTVSAMLHNRREVISFKKLKPAVQEMLRRNFTERHLGQIKKVFSEAYIFHQEKCRNFGSTSKTEQYDLILTPVAHTKVLIDDTRPASSDNGSTSMTPTCLLERRQDFHKRLLEITKHHHEEYLQSLDPPLVIPLDQVTRWHPQFEVDLVPDIEPESLPQPPNIEKYSTAKDVLARAKNLFNCNQRMEKALQMVSEEASKTDTPKSPAKTETSPVSKLLKGIPKGLLEKASIRAKQAAKALQAMTRSPAQDREATQHVRLPEMARILRNLFVAEKKSVLPFDFVLEKLGNSYREKLSRAELEEHVRLIIKIQPDWLKILETRKMFFLRLSKERDMGAVMKKLEGLAAEKNGTSV
ncbi:hypothetical protein C0J52_11001 [Blattella germanica]|nr:hypothetical protein C0J52_11001 [Blattella germanica]